MNRFFLSPRTARATCTIVGILGVIGLAYAVRRVLLVLALSLLFAYLLFPLVRLTQRWLIPTRALAIAVVYLVVLATAGGVGFAVAPRLTAEVRGLAEELPGISKRIQSGELVMGLLLRNGLEWRHIREIDRLLDRHMGAIVAYAKQTTATVVTGLAGSWVVVLVPVFAFFILKDVERLTAAMISRVRQRGARGRWWSIAGDLHVLLGQYVRALVLLSLITFVAWSAVFWTAGVPYALVLAAVGGALEFIPFIGPLTAAVIAVGVSLFTGYAHPWLLAVFILGWRGIQDFAVSPLVTGRGIDIHPALVIFGVLAGGEIAGVAGMFLSVPVIAAGRIVWRGLYTPESAPVDDRILEATPLPAVDTAA